MVTSCRFVNTIQLYVKTSLVWSSLSYKCFADSGSQGLVTLVPQGQNGLMRNARLKTYSHYTSYLCELTDCFRKEKKKKSSKVIALVSVECMML